MSRILFFLTTNYSNAISKSVFDQKQVFIWYNFFSIVTKTKFDSESCLEFYPAHYLFYEIKTLITIKPLNFKI